MKYNINVKAYRFEHSVKDDINFVDTRTSFASHMEQCFHRRRIFERPLSFVHDAMQRACSLQPHSCDFGS
jgi:hypothetical protein